MEPAQRVSEQGAKMLCSTANRPFGKATKSKINIHFKTINRLYSYCFSFENAGPNSVLD